MLSSSQTSQYQPCGSKKYNVTRWKGIGFCTLVRPLTSYPHLETLLTGHQSVLKDSEAVPRQWQISAQNAVMECGRVDLGLCTGCSRDYNPKCNYWHAQAGILFGPLSLSNHGDQAGVDVHDGLVIKACTWLGPPAPSAFPEYAFFTHSMKIPLTLKNHCFLCASLQTEGPSELPGFLSSPACVQYLLCLCLDRVNENL
jgi:hypothetical protein